jgi:hypothetical protein
MQRMKKKNMFTKIMAIAGTVLVWLPILAPILFSAASFIQRRVFRFDYLMPAELFSVALVGTGLLLWASWRAKSRQKLIGWGIALAAVMLVGGAVIARVTGLATGETEPTGWQWALVLTALAGYSLSLIIIGLGGIRLVGDVFKSDRNPAS